MEEEKRLPKFSKLTFSTHRVLLLAVSELKCAILFHTGELAVCENLSVLRAITQNEELLTIANIKVPVPTSVTDVLWDMIAPEANFLGLLLNSSALQIFQHVRGYNLELIGTLEKDKIIDAFAWIPRRPELVCITQEGELELYEVRPPSVSMVRKIVNLGFLLDEVCLRLSAPRDGLISWEGAQGTFLLFDSSIGQVRAISSDFALIPLVLSGGFNPPKSQRKNLVCERNWIKETLQSKEGTLVGISRLLDFLVCPNYFSLLPDCHDLLIIPLSEFSYKLTEDQVQFLQSSKKVIKIRLYNHVEVIEWSPFSESQHLFCTYDNADQFVVWTFESSEAKAIFHQEIGGVGLIFWITPDSILLVIQQREFLLLSL